MRKGSKMTEEQRKRVSLAQKKRMSNLEERKKFLEHRITPRFWTSKHLPEEERKRISESLKGKSSWIKGKHHSEESKRKMREGQRRRFANSEERKKLSENHKGQIPWIKGKYQSEEAKKKMSKSKKEKFALGEIRVWNKGKTGMYSEETRKKLSEATKKASPETRRKMLESWRKKFLSSPETSMKMKLHRATQIFPLKDSKPEKKIQGFLRQIRIKFLAHKYIDIEHAYQCDIFVPSINLVIEIDGDYWHGNPKLYPANKGLTERIINGIKLDTIRTKELQEKGFKVLRLWESDIKKMNLKDFEDKIN